MAESSQPPPNRSGLSLGRLMIVVALIAILLAGSIEGMRFVAAVQFATWSHGWNTSVLPIGSPVTLVSELRVNGDVLPPGVHGVVTADPPDEDSAYSYRLVSVKLASGPLRGATVGIQRWALRVR